MSQNAKRGIEMDNEHIVCKKLTRVNPIARSNRNSARERKSRALFEIELSMTIWEARVDVDSGAATRFPIVPISVMLVRRLTIQHQLIPRTSMADAACDHSPILRF